MSVALFLLQSSYVYGLAHLQALVCLVRSFFATETYIAPLLSSVCLIFHEVLFYSFSSGPFFLEFYGVFISSEFIV